MNKLQFLKRLDGALSGLNDDERKRQLDFYAEMIDDMTEDGLSEDEAILRLGSVQGIASKILCEAEPGQLRKKKKLGTGGKILIVLGALVLLNAIIVILFGYRNTKPTGDVDPWWDDVIDVEDSHLDVESWSHITDGSNLEITPDDMAMNGLSGIDIYWGYGNVTVGETEGENIIVNLGGIQGDLLCYEYDNGVLYLSNPDEDSDPGRNLELRILIPEDNCAIQKLSVATSDGDVSIDCETLADIRAVTASGKVNVSDTGEGLNTLSICTASGDIRAELDEDALGTDVRITSASGNVTLAVDEERSFLLDYATVTGKVSVGFDPRFEPDIKVGKNGESIYAQYEHKGAGTAMTFNVVTSSGDIRLIDD